MNRIVSGPVICTLLIIILTSNIPAEETHTSFPSLDYKGFLQGGFTASENIGGSAKDQNSFSVPMGRIKLFGDLADDFIYSITFESTRDISLLEAILEYRGLGEKAYLQTGQFKLPFSAETLVPVTQGDCISKYYFLTRMMPVACRDIGFMLSGQLDNRFRYMAGVFNGNGVNQKYNDDDGFLYTARCEFTALKQEDILLEFGLSFAGSHELDGNSSLESVLASAPGFAPYTKILAGADVLFRYGRSFVKSEYIGGTYDPDATGTDTVKAMGIGLTAGYFLVPKRTELILRGELFNPDTDDSAREDDLRYTLGLNYFPRKKVKLQANIVYEDNGTDVFSKLALLMQVGF